MFWKQTRTKLTRLKLPILSSLWTAQTESSNPEWTLIYKDSRILLQ